MTTKFDIRQKVYFLTESGIEYGSIEQIEINKYRIVKLKIAPRMEGIWIERDERYVAATKEELIAKL